MTSLQCRFGGLGFSALCISAFVSSALVSSTLGMSASAQAETIETVQVVAKKSGSALMESHEQIQARLNSVPGGTNLVDLADATKLSSLSDALNYQPGIIVQEFFGGLDQPRLNVRGSGIQGNPVSRGVLLRQNYLPLNDADGSFIVGLLNLRNSQTITVHRGANSRVPGSSSRRPGRNMFHSPSERASALRSSIKLITWLPLPASATNWAWRGIT